MTIEDILFLYSTNDTVGRKFNFVTGDLSAYVQDMYSVSLPGGGRAWKANVIGGGSGGGVTTIGTIDTGTLSDDGASISGTTLYMQTASDSYPGLVSIDTQTFKGVKTFLQAPVLNSLTNGSVLFAGSDKSISQDNSMFFWDDTNNIFYVGANSGAFTNSKIHAQATVNSYSQINSINLSNGTSASTDFIATADTGTDSINYADFGINSSTYSDASFTISGALDSYFYGNGGNLVLGTATAAKTIKFHTGGTLAANLRMTIADTTLTLANLATTNTFTGQTANTVINGLSLINSTAATTGNQQYSPYITQQGFGFGSTGSVNRSTAFRYGVVPVQGTTNPSAYWTIESSINGGAFGGSMSLTSAGNLGIGTIAPSGIIHAAQAAAGANIVLTESSDTGVMPASFVSQRSRGTSLTSPTAIQTGNGLGGWIIQGYNGTAYVTCAQINGVAAQTFTGSVNGAHIVFQTTTNGLTAINEKMRLTDAGNLGIGLTTVPGYLSIKAGTTTVPPVLLTNSSTTLVASPTVGMMEYTNIGGNNLLTFVRTGTTREVMVTGKITAGSFLAPITNKALVIIGDDGAIYNVQLTN